MGIRLLFSLEAEEADVTDIVSETSGVVESIIRLEDSLEKGGDAEAEDDKELPLPAPRGSLLFWGEVEEFVKCQPWV